MKRVLISVIFVSLFGFQSTFLIGSNGALEKNSESERKIEERKKKTGQIGFYEQKRIFEYSDAIRSSCQGIYLSHAKEISVANKNGLLNLKFHDINSKYKTKLSADFEISRPPSSIYGDPAFSDLERKSVHCRSALFAFVSMLETPHISQEEKAMILLELYEKMLAINTLSYAFEYNHYSSPENLLKARLGSTTFFIYSYYQIMKRVLDNLKKPSEKLDLENDFDEVYNKITMVEKDFNVFRGFVLALKIKGKLVDKEDEIEIDILEESILKKILSHQSFLSTEYQRFKVLSKGEGAYNSFISMYLDIVKLEVEMNFYAKEYQNLVLKILGESN